MVTPRVSLAQAYASGSTTTGSSNHGYQSFHEQDTSAHPTSLFLTKYARLIPINDHAIAAVQQTMENASSYHQAFITQCTYAGQPRHCFLLDMERLPQYPGFGWRIGRGRTSMHKSFQHSGVDLLLTTVKNDKVAGLHARFGWIAQSSGFFLCADLQSSKHVLLNGKPLTGGRSVIPRDNTIAIGECFFIFEYLLSPEDEQEELFQTELGTWMRKFCGDANPLILPTPKDNDTTFGSWRVQWALDKGSYGTVYMVTHATSGKPAAAKHILKTKRNQKAVDRELAMTKQICNLDHPNVAKVIEIFEQGKRTKFEINRIRTALGGSWDPQDIMESFLIISPFMPTTLAYVCENMSSQGSNSVIKARNLALFSDLTEGVAFLHDHGIAHRDLKPANVLVQSFDPPHAIVTDFGCACSQRDIPFEKNIGTLLYLAPEQVEGRTHTKAVDLWALGLIALEMMGADLWSLFKGRLLPEAGKFQKLITKLSEASDPLAFCALNMLVEDPKGRLPAVDVFTAVIPRLTEANGISSNGKRKANELESYEEIWAMLEEGLNPTASWLPKGPPEEEHLPATQKVPGDEYLPERTVEVTTEEFLRPMRQHPKSKDGHPKPKCDAPQSIPTETTVEMTTEEYLRPVTARLKPKKWQPSFAGATAELLHPLKKYLEAQE